LTKNRRQLEKIAEKIKFFKMATGGDDMLAKVYRTYGGFVGGDASDGNRIVGGLDGTKHYGSTVMSKAKKALIKDIAKDLAHKLGIPGLRPEGKDLDTLVNDLRKYLPDPRPKDKGGNKKSWSDKSSSQEKACKIIAEVINTRFGSVLINPKASPSEVCDQAAEIMHSLATGIHGEFLGVHKDAEKVMKNLKVLGELLKRSHSRVMSQKTSSDDPEVQSNLALADEAHKNILIEFDRQSQMLQNMLNLTVTPADKDLAKLLKETNDFKQFVKRIKQLPGTSKFGEKLAFVLTGIGSTAQMAHSVNKALKTIGMSVSEYENTKSADSLRTKMDKLLQKNLHGASGKQIDDYLKAANMLMKYEYRHGDVAKHLKKTGGFDDMIGDDGTLITGSAERVQGGLKLDKRVADRKDAKKGMLAAFNRRFTAYLDQILETTEALAKEIGAGKVELSDLLLRWSKSLDQVPNLERRQIYLALTGYHKGIHAKEERERFVSSVKHVVALLEALTKEKRNANVSQFQDLKKLWGELIGLIQDFASKFEEGFGVVVPKGLAKEMYKEGAVEGAGFLDFLSGRGKAGQMLNPVGAAKRAIEAARARGVAEDSEEMKALKAAEAAARGKSAARKNVARGVAGDALVVTAVGVTQGKEAAQQEGFNRVLNRAVGSAEGSAEGAAEMEYIMGGDDISMSDVNRIAYDLEKVKGIVRFYVRTTSIRDNLKKLAVENKHYGKEYDKVLGDAVASARDQISKELADMKKHLADENSATYKAMLALAVEGGLTTTQSKDIIKKLYTFRSKFYQVKDNMLKVGEAVDIYMKVFTDSIISNPNDLQKVQVMLRGTEVISKWFSKNSGDLITQVFDSFPDSAVPALNADPTYPSTILRSWNKATNKDMHASNTAGANYKPHYPDVHYYWRVQNAMQPGGAAGLAAARTNFDNQREIMGIETTGQMYSLDGNAVWRDVGPNPIAAGQPGVRATPSPGVLTKGNDERTKLPLVEGEHNLKKVVKLIKTVFENMVAFKNIMSAFIAIGDRFGGKDLKDQTHMTPKQIYDGLVEYMTYSSIYLKHDVSPKAWAVRVKGPVTNNTGAINPGGAAPIVEDTPVPAVQVNDLSPGERAEAYLEGQLKKINDSDDLFKHEGHCDTDWLFELVVKSIVAKILTVIGSYNMLNRPFEKSATGYYSDMRQALGGDDTAPTVIPEALELYIRLPLLAEFYREIMDIRVKGETENKFLTLSFVPEFEGTFAGLVEFVFDKARHITTGTYSSTDIARLVLEINKVYSKYKSSENAIGDAVSDFIDEVNRRYGIIRATERDRYVKELENRYLEGTAYDDESSQRVDFEILPGGEDEGYKRPALSDAYLTETGTYELAHKHKIDREHQRFINQLRTKLEEKFSLVAQGENIESVSGKNALDSLKYKSFENVIRARSEELKHAKTPRDKFAVVTNAINGFGEYSLNSLENTLVLAHETLATGLNSLRNLYNLLEQFRGRLDTVVPGAVPANFSELFELLVGHAQDLHGMVELRLQDVDYFSDAGETAPALPPAAGQAAPAGNAKVVSVQLDHSKLRETILRQFRSLKAIADRFRGLLPKKIMDSYELFEKNGSIYKLENDLVNKLLMGRYRKEDEDWSERHLDNANTWINTLIRRFMYTAPAAAGDYGTVNDALNALAGREVIPNAGVHTPLGGFTHGNAIHQGIPDIGILKLLFKPLGSGVPSNRAMPMEGLNATIPNAPAPVTVRVRQTDNLRGAVGAFNRLLRQYISQFFDTASQKMYISVVNNFANAAFSAAVRTPEQCLDDSGNVVVNYGSNVLYLTNAAILRNIITSNVPGKTNKMYMEIDLTEIPMFMRENYRANMPVFRKQFLLLARRCETLNYFAKAMRNDPVQGTLNEVIRGCQSMIACIDETLGELTDEPVYLETHSDSIKTYKSTHGVTPLMPLSSALWYLRDGTQVPAAHPINQYSEHVAMPLQQLGTDTFKLHYGTRGLLCNGEINWAKVPGFKEIISKHNETTDSQYHFSESDLSDFLTDTVNILRYVIDAKHYKWDLVRDTAIMLAINSNFDETATDNRGALVLPLVRGATLSSVLRLTENSNKAESVRTLVQQVQSSDKSIIRGTRDQIRTMNIIDMNVVPFRFQALMREIPFVNLYNYAHTYDTLICDLFGIDYAMRASPGSSGDGKLDEYLGMTGNAKMTDEKAKRFMGVMLMHPYREVTFGEYDEYVARIMRGAVGVDGFGRPKFLGDELYNKALFGGLYEDSETVDEAGPGLGHGREHGIGSNHRMRSVLRTVIEEISETNGTNVRIAQVAANAGEGSISDDGVIVAPDLNNSAQAGPNRVQITDTLTAIQAIKVHAAINALKSPVLHAALRRVRQDGTIQTLTGIADLRILAEVTAAVKNIHDSVTTALSHLDKAKGANDVGFIKASAPAWMQPIKAHLAQIGGISWALGNPAPNDAAWNIASTVDELGDFVMAAHAQTRERRAPRTHSNGDSLHYMHRQKNGKAKLVKVQFTQQHKAELMAIGRERFDTFFVRNIFWGVQIQRALRYKIRKETEWFNSKVVSDMAIMSKGITEQYDNEAHDYDT